MSKSVLVMETPENCYVCPFGTAYCSALEYEGLCELADCLDCDVILMTEEHYDCESKSRPDWCHRALTTVIPTLTTKAIGLLFGSHGRQGKRISIRNKP